MSNLSNIDFENLSRDDLIAILECKKEDILELMNLANSKRESNFVTYSKNVFIPLTKICRNDCGYCAFKQNPDDPNAIILMEKEEVLSTLREAEKYGCKEALFTIGEDADTEPAVKAKLDKLGYKNMVDYIYDICKMTVEETALFPHTNAGNFSYEDMKKLKEYNISMGNDCISSLISRVNSSMRSIDNEMQKIILYCEYTKTTRVTMELLDKLCVPDVHASVFQMTDAIGQRKPGRALEIFKVTGKKKSVLDKESIKGSPYKYDVYEISWDREELYDRINKRVDLMIEAGLVDEVKNVISKYNVSKTALQALGYKEVLDYFDEKYSYDEMIEKIKMESRRYAKRQITWFNHIKEKTKLDGKDKEKMLQMILQKYTK